MADHTKRVPEPLNVFVGNLMQYRGSYACMNLCELSAKVPEVLHDELDDLIVVIVDAVEELEHVRGFGINDT